MVIHMTKLFELREYHNLTQKQVAEKLGIRQQTYSDWETDKKTIPLKHLISIAKLYKVNIDYIIGLTNDKDIFFSFFKLDNQIIGQNIITIRNTYHLSQKELALFLNTTPSTICAYEKGKTTILTVFAIEIAKKCNISIDWLIGASTHMHRELVYTA